MFGNWRIGILKHHEIACIPPFDSNHFQIQRVNIHNFQEMFNRQVFKTFC